MPSWSLTQSPPEEVATQPTPAARATAIERARRLLEQILRGPRNQAPEEPPRPDLR